MVYVIYNSLGTTTHNVNQGMVRSVTYPQRQYLGTVEAPDRPAALKQAAEKFPNADKEKLVAVEA